MERFSLENFKLIKMIFIIAVFISPLFSQTDVNTYSVNKINKNKITVDGILDEPEWEVAEKSESFVILATGESSDMEIWAKMLWDEDNFYLAFYSEDPDMYSDYGEYQDDHFYQRDDLVEAFIDFDGDGYDYLEIGLSPRNINYDFIIIDPDTANWQNDTAWDISSFETAISLKGTLDNHYDRDTSWIAEIKIPFSSLNYWDFGFSGNVSENDEWRVNLYRIDFDNYTPEWEPNNEYAWCPMGENNAHLPDKFGKIIFKDIITSVKHVKKNLHLNKSIKNKRYFTLNGKEIPANDIQKRALSHSCYIVQYEYANSKTMHKKIHKDF